MCRTTATGRRCARLCDKYGILLIADEVINGFGRTGKWFGVDHFDIKPDIMTTAKGLSSGYAPIACAMTTRKVADAFATDKASTFAHGITFGTHPVSCAVALRNVQIIEEEGLVDNSARTGAYLLEQLKQMQTRHPTVGDVRGLGLMVQIDLVKDRVTKEPFGQADDMQTKIGDRLKQRGLLCRAGTSINIAPPLITHREDVDEIVDIIDAVIGEFEAELV